MSGKDTDKPAVEDSFGQSTHDAFDHKDFSKHYDPCQEAADRSIKCIHRNPGNKDLCNDYFQAYRDCKKAWSEARKAAGKGWFASR